MKSNNKEKRVFFNLPVLCRCCRRKKGKRKKVQHFRSLFETVYTKLVFLCESSKKSIKGKNFFFEKNAKKNKNTSIYTKKKRLNNLKLGLKERNVNNFNNVDMKY